MTKGGLEMECAYCLGHVVVVDAWKNYKVVECAACGVRYDVRDEKEENKAREMNRSY